MSFYLLHPRIPPFWPRQEYWRNGAKQFTIGGFFVITLFGFLATILTDNAHREYQNSPWNYGWHTPMLDIDMPARLIQSSTPGHHHLYIDRPVSWFRYRILLWALYKAGIIEEGFYRASIKRKATHLRPPWIDKEK